MMMMTRDKPSCSFHLDDAPIHAMLDWSDFPSMIREIAYHYGVERENVLDAHEMTVQPSDVPAGAVPLIVQQVQDVPVGAAYVLILVDIEIHGQWMEAPLWYCPGHREKSCSGAGSFVTECTSCTGQGF